VGPAVKCGLPGARPASSMIRVPASGGGLEAMIRGCIWVSTNATGPRSDI
jgi:hypothetical protein